MIGVLTEDQIEEVLKKNILGRIGCNDGKRTYVVPINYVYHDKFIIAHAAMGTKIEIMRKNPQVCFEVDEIINSSNWKSVIAWGEYQELTDQRGRFACMRLFADRMMHIKVNEKKLSPQVAEELISSPTLLEMKPIIFYRIVIAEKTGRFENE